jgi:hypothetical protein
MTSRRSVSVASGGSAAAPGTQRGVTEGSRPGDVASWRVDLRGHRAPSAGGRPAGPGRRLLQGENVIMQDLTPSCTLANGLNGVIQVYDALRGFHPAVSFDERHFHRTALPQVQVRQILRVRRAGQISRRRRLEAASEEYERPATVSSQVTFRQEAAFTSLGMDPLVSFASVVHELSYGRITPVGGLACEAHIRGPWSLLHTLLTCWSRPLP